MCKITSFMLIVQDFCMELVFKYSKSLQIMKI